MRRKDGSAIEAAMEGHVTRGRGVGECVGVQ